MSKNNKTLTAVASRAHELRKELLTLAATATGHFFRLGEIMKEYRDKELWRAGYESFGAFYSDPELDYKKSNVYHSIKLVELFPDWKQMIDIPYSKLIRIAPHINESNKKGLVADARGMSYSDLSHELVVKKLIHSKPEIKHFPKIYPCNTCAKCKGVVWEDLCHCGWTLEQIEYVGKLIDSVNMGGELRGVDIDGDEHEI